MLAVLHGGPCAAQAPRAQAPPARPTIVRDLAYPGARPGERRRSLDLYLPARPRRTPPLLVFVHGGWWRQHDDEGRIGPAVAEALVPDGVAVALLRYRLAPAARHPAAAEDVAAGLALLLGGAGRWGYDPARVVLAGHGAGAHLAALATLDPAYLDRHGLSAARLAGLVLLGGRYDLAGSRRLPPEERAGLVQAFGEDPEVLGRASPRRHVRPDLPPVLILSAQGDDPDRLIDARLFADALAGTGHPRVDAWIVPGRDHLTLLRLADPANGARPLVLHALGAGALPAGWDLMLAARRRWRDPPFSTRPFWRHEALIRSHPVDRHLVSRTFTVFGDSRFELLAWPLERFHAIALPALLAALPAERVGSGDHLVITNIAGERQVWPLDRIRPWEPVVVVGLDDERNLFRLGVFYRNRQEYSWTPGPPPPAMARPLGAFVHFLRPPPPELRGLPAHFGLTVDSFRLVAGDPLAPLADLPPAVWATLAGPGGCLACHSWRGVGARSHHVEAGTGRPHGGFALPLEAYPPEVWRAFLFDQGRVARTIGVAPNPVPPGVREVLHDLVSRSRAAPEGGPRR